MTPFGARPRDDVRFESTGVESKAFGFVRNVHVLSNTGKGVQVHAITRSVSDEKSQGIQTHAGLSQNLAGSLLDGIVTSSESRRAIRPVLSARHAAKILGVCTATIYRLCERGTLPHFRVQNAIRVDIQEAKNALRQSGRRRRRRS